MRKHSTSASSRRLNTLLAATAAVAATIAAMPADARGQTATSWTGGTGNYNTGTNWSSGNTPTNAANELLVINNGGTAQVGANAEGSFLHLGLEPGDTGNLEVTGGTLTLGELRVGGRESIPDGFGGGSPNGGGTGSVVQTGGTVAITFSNSEVITPVQSLYIGDAGLTSGNTANGSYTIRNNAVLVSGIANNDQIVIGSGAGARGTFVQEGTSSVTSTGHIYVGRRGGTATYTMSGGTLQVGDPALTVSNMNLFVGDGADTADTGVVAGTSATFAQSAGAVITRNGVDIGRRGGTGTYTISGGTINTSSEFRVGSNGSSAEVAHQTGNGTLNVSGTAAITVGTNLHVGISSSTLAGNVVGTLNMNGGSISMPLSNAVWAIGNGLGTSGTADISGGTLTSTGATAVAEVGRNNGSGLLRVRGVANVSVNQLTISSSTPASATGTRELKVESGGTLNVAFWEMGGVTPGANVTRTVNVSGGTLNVTGDLTHRGGRGIQYNFTGGATTFSAGTFVTDTSTLTVSNTASVSFANFRTGGVASGVTASTNITGGAFAATTVNPAGANAGGVTTVSNGTVNVGTWNVTNGNPATTAGNLNITGGNVNVTNLVLWSNPPATPTTTSTLHITGGTLNVPNLSLSSNSVLKTDNDISLASAVALGNVTVDVNSGSLSLTGPVAVPADGRTLTKTGPGTLTLGGAWSYNATTPGTSNLNATAGTVHLNADVNGPVNLNVSPGATVNLNASQTVKDVSVSGAMAVAAGGSKVLTANALTIPGGTLDLTNNSLLVDAVATPADTVRSYLASAFNAGAWNGPGLTSSTARDRADNATGLGYVVTGSQVLVKYTFVGDLDLGGSVDADDYVRIDRGLAMGLTGWANGDVDYSGAVSPADYLLMDAAYINQGIPLSPEFLADREARFGSDYIASLVAAVPEPASTGVAAGLAAISLMSRRRRHSR